MRIAIMTMSLCLALGGCKTSGDLRTRQIYEQSETIRSVDDVAGCIALAIAGREIEIGKEIIPNGIAITMAMRPAGVKTVMNVYDIVDLGQARRVTLYSIGSRNEQPRPIDGPAAKCI